MGNLFSCGQGHQFTQTEFVQAGNMVSAGLLLQKVPPLA